MMKRCSSCKENKEINLFPKNRSRKDGLHHSCKECINGKRRAKYAENPKPFIDKSKDYRARNTEKCRATQRSYCKLNRSKRTAKEAIKRKERYAQDPKFRAIINARARIGNFLRNKEKYSKALGCSFEMFVIHIEAQFKPGMNWDNYGEWHIDHAYPLSVAHDLGPESFKKACHYTNLQPLWALENLKKGIKLITPIL